MVKEFLFDDRQTLIKTLAADCQDYLQTALQDKGAASLMVSGGSTPAPMYKQLSEADLNWQNIAVALVDERWVDQSHDASNEALMYRALLQKNATSATFTGMKTQAATAIKGWQETESRYQQITQPFTVTLLGMGNDGHTASLFPHAEGLAKALDSKNPALTAPITAKQSVVTGANTERLTLTLTGLMQSKRMIILLTGEQKLEVFRTAQQLGSIEDMPIRAVIHQDQVPVELYWAP